MPSFTVAVFLPGKDIQENPLDIEYYRQAYFELSQEVSKLGGLMVIVRDPATYLGNGQFSRAWEITAPGEYQLLSETTANVVFDKGKFPTDNTVPVFNHPAIHEICTDKFLMYERLQRFCPATFLVKNYSEYQGALDQIHTEQVVVKPVYGHEGYGVEIDSHDKLLQAEVVFPVVVQEFLDTSCGVPGIVDSYHDLRVALFNGEIIYSYVRTPPPGKLTSNVSQGGQFFMIDPQRLPPELFDIIAEIDAEFCYVGPRFYGIDFGLTPQGPKIIEMNSRLGLLPNSDGPEFAVVKQRLAEAFRSLALQEYSTA